MIGSKSGLSWQGMWEMAFSLTQILLPLAASLLTVRSLQQQNTTQTITILKILCLERTLPS